MVPSRCPERAEVDHRIARLPAGEEALDRRMEAELVQLVDPEHPMASDGGVG
jgi:hypothetical protein